MFKKKREIKEAVKESHPRKNRVTFGMKPKLLLSFISLVIVFCAIITVVLTSRSARFVEQEAIADINDRLSIFELLLQEQETLLRSLADSMKLDMIAEMGSEERETIEMAVRIRHAVFKQNHDLTTTRLYDPNLRLIHDASDTIAAGSDGSNQPLLKNALGFGSGKLVSGFEFEDNQLMLFSAGPVNKPMGIAGIIQIGRAIDNDYLDKIKERTGFELAVYMGNECVATTLAGETENGGAAGEEVEATTGATGSGEEIRLIGTTLDHQQILETVLTQGERWSGRLELSGKSLFGAYKPIRDSNDNIIGMLFAGTPAIAYDQQQQENWEMGLLILLAAAVITALFSLLLANRIVGPLTELSKVFTAVSQGDFTVTVKEYGKDEVGLIGRAVANMIHNLRGFVSHIADLAGKVQFLSRGVADTTENISSSVQDVADSINEVASSMNVLSSSSQVMAQEATETAEKAASSQEEMDHALEQMRAIEGSFEELKETIEQFSRRSAEIGEIIQVINDISEQTNLLALNAAIEAARAGENGRGFAVVADEVRKLAERSSASTEEIDRLIRATQNDASLAVAGMDKSASAVRAGSRAMASSSETFGEIITIIQGLLEKINEVATSSQEVSASSEEVAASTEEQSAAVEEIAASTEELEAASRLLLDELQKFKF